MSGVIFYSECIVFLQSKNLTFIFNTPAVVANRGYTPDSGKRVLGKYDDEVSKEYN